MTHQKYINTPPRVWQSLWEISLPLSTAYFELIPDVMKNKYLELREKGGPYAQAEAARKQLLEESKKKKKNDISKEWPFAKDVTVWSILGGAVKTFSESVLEGKAKEFVYYEEFRDDLRNSLTRKLNSGKLIAIGYSKDRRPQDLASIAPSDLVSKGYFNWNESTLYTASLEMIDIRISTTEMFQDCLDEDIRDQLSLTISLEQHQNSIIEVTPNNTETSPSSRQTKTPSQGRASRKQHIIEAYSSLIDENIISENSSSKQFAHEIRIWVKARYDDPPTKSDGLSHETIRRIVREAQQNTK